MAKHEFGIMMNTPRQSERYDEYEPWKYECISVDDKDLEGVVERLSSLTFIGIHFLLKAKGLLCRTYVNDCRCLAFFAR